MRNDSVKFRNTFSLRHYREGKLITVFDALNAIVTVGKNNLLDVHFGATSKNSAWYFGLINNSPTPTLLDADTLASHSGWSEWTNYSGNRKQWVNGAASNGSKTSTSLASFTINATGNLYGALLCTVDTGTSGILWAHAAFPNVVPVVDTDIIKLNYTVSIVTA